MDVMTATAVQEKSMTIFTIDSENQIAAHGSASEVTDKACEQFTNEKELAQLAADWPGSRLEVSLKDRLQDELQCPLDHAITNRRCLKSL